MDINLFLMNLVIIIVFSGLLFFFIRKNKLLNQDLNSLQKINNQQLEQIAIHNERQHNFDQQIKEKNSSLIELQSQINHQQEQYVNIQQQLTKSQTINQNLQENYNAIKDQEVNYQQKINELNHQLNDLIKDNGQLQFQKQNLDQQLSILKNEINKNQENSLQQFENLANKILEDKAKRFTEVNSVNIQNILNPIQKNLEDFKKQVHEVYDKESKERFSLTNEIKNLQENSNKISEQANNLVNALKGNIKKQGDWGEMILETILQHSGLIKDINYFREKSFTDDNNKRLRPDFQILLPDNRKIITDSKVSLIAYESFCNTNNQQQQKEFINNHLKSIYSHIDILASKKYHELDMAIDFVIMFIPVEPAYLLALQADAELWFYAYEKRILLVSPTNLIACLKLIDDLWKREMQNKNAKKIVEQAEKLYEKIHGFLENFNDLEKNINRLNDSFEKAKNQLIDGRGNIILQTQKLHNLGLKSAKQIPENFLSSIDLEIDNDVIIENN